MGVEGSNIHKHQLANLDGLRTDKLPSVFLLFVISHFPDCTEPYSVPSYSLIQPVKCPVTSVEINVGFPLQWIPSYCDSPDWLKSILTTFTSVQPCLSFFFLCFLGPHMQHMEVPRLGVESELQLPSYATAMPDPSHIFNICCSLQQCWIRNPWVRPGIKSTFSWIFVRFITCWTTQELPALSLLEGSGLFLSDFSGAETHSTQMSFFKDCPHIVLLSLHASIDLI